MGPLLNAKRLQQKLGWAALAGDQPGAPPAASSHWFYTLAALLTCFQEVEQLEEARDHCEHALRALIPAQALLSAGGFAWPPPGRSADAACLHPLLRPLAQAMVRLSWQTGRDKRQWEELLRKLEAEGAELDNEPTLRDFLLKHTLEDGEAEG